MSHLHFPPYQYKQREVSLNAEADHDKGTIGSIWNSKVDASPTFPQPLALIIDIRLPAKRELLRFNLSYPKVQECHDTFSYHYNKQQFLLRYNTLVLMPPLKFQ